MKLNNIKLRGITCFTAPEPVGIDLDSLGPGLVALVGANGAGKSTLLEAVPAVLYKSLPTRPGSLYDHAHGRDAFVEAIFNNDQHELKVRIQIDAEQRKTEAYLFEDGRSLTTGRAADFEVEIIKRFGSRDLFLASVLAAQDKAGDFLRMMKRERKQLFSEMLGLSYLETLHDLAKDCRSGSEKDLGIARAILKSEELLLSALPELDAKHNVARIEADKKTQRLEEARNEETEAITTLERARAAKEQLKFHEAAFSAAEREAEQAQSALSEAEALPLRIEEQLRKRLEALEAQDPEVLVRRARERHGDAERRCRARLQLLESILAMEPEILTAQNQVIAMEKELVKLEISERNLTEIRAQEIVAEGKLSQAEREIDDARKARVTERNRLERQAELLEKVPCTEEDGSSIGGLSTTCPLLSEARGAREYLVGFKAQDGDIDTTDLDSARKALEDLRAGTLAISLECDPLRLKELKQSLPKAQATAGEVASIDRAKREMESINTEFGQLAGALERDLQEAFSARTRIAAERKQIAEERHNSLKEAATKAATAHLTLEEALERRLAASGELGQAQTLCEVMKVPTCLQRHSEAVMARKRAERELHEADQQLAGIAARIEDLQKRASSLHTYKDEVVNAETELGDWSLLEGALGRDGIQALEIDAAGPEVARLTNELLEACYGPRFSISFETLREKKSARGEYIEAFDVIVYDNGRERAVEVLSGGERVVVGEAIGLAFSIFNARKSTVRWETLFRDETAGALDPESADRYVLMLRRALILGGFKQCVFVAHQPAVFEAADIQIVVADGKVSVGGHIPNAKRRIQEESPTAR